MHARCLGGTHTHPARQRHPLTFQQVGHIGRKQAELAQLGPAVQSSLQARQRQVTLQRHLQKLEGRDVREGADQAKHAGERVLLADVQQRRAHLPGSAIGRDKAGVTDQTEHAGRWFLIADVRQFWVHLPWAARAEGAKGVNGGIRLSADA